MPELRDPWLAAALIAAVPAVVVTTAAGIPPPVRPEFWPALCWWIAGTVLVYPLLEEAVFRGLIQAALLARGGGRRVAGLSLANLATSICFAAAHVWIQGSLQAALVCIPSLVFGFFFERYGGIGVPVLLHASYNAVWLAMALLR